MKSWIASSVIYQVNLRGLAAREPRNAFEAAREKRLTASPLAYVAGNLAYIKQLGAHVVYFMPPYPIGRAFRKGIGSPYSIRDFLAIEPEYGTKKEMADLVRKAHRLGLKVIFDITPNHTSRDNVWMASHPDFYVKRDNGEVFHDCDWSDTAKLDYTNPELRREMIAIYDHWLGFLGRGDGIDGFRLDMAHFINDKSFWNEAMAELRRRHADRELLFLAECYGLEPNCDLFARGIDAAYDDDFYKCCQYLYGLDEHGNTAIVPDAGLPGNGGFRDRYDAFKSGGVAGAFAKALMNYEDRYGRADQPPRLARYTDNHDEGRGMYLYGEGAVRAVNALVFTSPRALPFLLTGEEFGAVNRPPIHDRMNPIGKKRRIRRADGSYWEQDSVEFEGNSFAREPRKRAELFRYFKSLIRLRRTTPELVHGDFRLIGSGENAPPHECSVIAFDRCWKGRTVRCAINLGPSDRTLRSDVFTGQPLFGGLSQNTLPAFGAVVVRRAAEGRRRGSRD
jgi:glycosidase